jgi:hypothetical protein
VVRGNLAKRHGLSPVPRSSNVGLQTEPSSMETFRVGVGHGTMVASWVPDGGEAVRAEGGCRRVQLNLSPGSPGRLKGQGGERWGELNFAGCERQRGDDNHR